MTLASASEPDRHSTAGRPPTRTRPTARTSLVHDFSRQLRGTERTGALSVLHSTARTLLKVTPADVWCAVMLDPSTLLDTGGIHTHGFSTEVMPRLFEIEHADQVGVDNLRALTRRNRPVSVLSQSTKGQLADSIYYRDVLRPSGLGDELRVLLRDGSRTWGLFVLCRSSGTPPFTSAEVELAAALSAPATLALRRSLLLGGIDSDGVPDATGLLILDDEQQVHLCTSTAEHLLGLIQEAHSRPRQLLPYALQALVNTAQGVELGVQVHSRALGSTGHWITLSAWREKAGGPSGLGGAEGAPLTYVSLAPTHPRDLTALVLDAYGLTPRERDVAQQVLLGRSTAEVSTALHITEYTVQDHLRKVFDKAGVRSRREFTGELFQRCYLPLLNDPPLTTDGRMRHDPPGRP
ncbi:LuxR C-terminal-related transcriptional regulator [Streptomyces sp. NPDC005963]|uniref:LuxR C-terminal-related transcriptional regulator n=1 Tax=Streptomyces sp. NPDC005963 TaxID=3156721 RepID=UPI0033FD4316